MPSEPYDFMAFTVNLTSPAVSSVPSCHKNSVFQRYIHISAVCIYFIAFGKFRLHIEIICIVKETVIYELRYIKGIFR